MFVCIIDAVVTNTLRGAFEYRIQVGLTGTGLAPDLAVGAGCTSFRWKWDLLLSYFPCLQLKNAFPKYQISFSISFHQTG